MKKLLFMIAMGVFTSMYVNSAKASILGVGIKVTYDKGTKEWNADKTSTECVGKGVCKITIEVDIPLGVYTGGIAVGLIGMSEKGQLQLSFPRSVIQDAQWAETFSNNKLYIGKDVELSGELRHAIRNCPASIKAGNYAYRIIGEEVLVTVSN